MNHNAVRSVISLPNTLSRLAHRSPPSFYRQTLNRFPSFSSSALFQSFRLIHVPRHYYSQTRCLTNAAQSENNKSTHAAGDASASSAPRRQSMTRDIREHAEKVKHGSACTHDNGLIRPDDAKIFPRIKTTSLSTKRIVIHDEASSKAVTLVMVAFRSFADDQLLPWREAFVRAFADKGGWYDLTVNESFSAQALSGFVQRWQRGRTDPALHDFYVAFNSRAREPLESLMLTTNRMFGNVLLLDRNARVRFRASGPPSDDGLEALLNCAKQLLDDDKTGHDASKN